MSPVAIHLPAIWEDEVGVCLEEHALQPKVGANCFVEIRIPDALTLVVREIEELGREDVAVRGRDGSLVGDREASQLLLEIPYAALVHDLSEKLLDVAQGDAVERTCLRGWDREQVVRPTMGDPPREGDQSSWRCFPR